jgi:hypothetical protein
VIRKYESSKKLASFYVFGYLLEFRIECDDLFFLIRFFFNVGEEQLKKHYHHLRNFDPKKMSSTSKRPTKEKSYHPYLWSCLVMGCGWAHFNTYNSK